VVKTSSAAGARNLSSVGTKDAAGFEDAAAAAAQVGEKNAFSDEEEFEGQVAGHEDFFDDLEEYEEHDHPDEVGDDYLVPVKKREFEKMFNLKVTESPEPTAQGDWKEDAQFQAPNDPLLLINWTRLSKGVIVSDPTGALTGLTKEQREARDAVLDLVLDNFESKCEELFKEELAYHTDTSIWDKDMQKIAKKNPGECWGPLGYPRMTGNFDVKESWAKISRPSKFNSGSPPCFTSPLFFPLITFLFLLLRSFFSSAFVFF